MDQKVVKMVDRDEPWRAQLRYELAQDTLGDIVDCYAAMIGDELKKADSDQVLVNKWVKEAMRIRDVQDSLRIADAEKALQEYCPIARNLMDQWQKSREVS